MHVKKGDTVVVIAGKDKGKTGKVLTAMPKKDRVVVEGVNIVVKHQKPTQENQQGGRIEQEGSIHVSNVMFYSAKEKKGVRIGHKIDNGKKVRVSTSGEILD